RSAMPVARVNGIDLYYEELGAGPHLVVAHGLMGSVAMLPLFGERIDAIAARGVHVIAYDARGHGRSGYTANPRDYTWRSLAADLFGLIRALGIEGTSVYGGSMGAGTAVTLALDHPETVEKLILQSPPPTGVYLRRVRPMFLWLAMLVQVFGPRASGRIVARLPRRPAAPAFDIAAFIGAQRRAAVVPAIRGLLRGPPLPTHRYGEIRQQALVLTHPDDPIHPLASGELLHERMPHAKLAVAPTPTYWAENPDALAHVVGAFVRGEQIARGLPGHGSSRIS
ncbi:MAG: alpha/beta hydrolase, partial [Chloroflexota bacterium]|nr:alpha/beta hydrolase [Chloroflexota bacterium]